MEITVGVVLLNLGSPNSIQVHDVKKYLHQFLMDERVIDKSYFFRLLLVKGIIVPFRAAKSAEAYKLIWTSSGSPLIALTRQLQAQLQLQTVMPIEVAMRYGNPTPKEAFDKLIEQHTNLKHVLVVPMYPQYAMSSYETAVEYAKEVHNENNYAFSLSFIKPFYNNADYISALSEKIKPYLDNEYDHILFSYHGIPERHIKKSDGTGKHCLKVQDCCNVKSPAHATCYRHQCFETTQAVTKKLGIATEKYSVSFQSRLGKGWLQPFTDIRLLQMPQEGIKKLLIVCPAFVTDCLETLEEIECRGKESFLSAGGTTFKLIPCLNDSEQWVNVLLKWAHEFADGKRENILQNY